MSELMNVAPASVVGEGPVKVIAVHGWMGDHQLFAPSFPYWDRQLLSVAFLDCRGYGARSNIPGDLTVEEIADDVRSLARSLGWSRYHVLGHSMAGMSAQLLAAEASHEVVSAILVASVPASGAKITDERRALLNEAIVDPEARKRLIDVNTGCNRSDDWLVALRDLSVSGTNREALEGYMRSWTGTDLSNRVNGSATPALALLGELDPGASKARTEETVGSWFANLQVVVMPATGHYPMYERPEQFVASVSRELLPY